MPLPPDVRRERRAALSKSRPAPTYPRRRCMNCNGWYLKIRKNKKFCSRQCQKEFGRFGNAFGPLKDYLTKLITSKSQEETAKHFAPYLSSKEFRRHLAAAGFIHRSQIKKRPTHLQTKSLHAQINMTGLLLKELAGRVTALENYRASGRMGQDPTPSDVAGMPPLLKMQP